MVSTRLKLKKPDSIRLHLGTITMKQFRQLAVKCGVVVQRCAVPEQRFGRTRLQKRRWTQVVVQTAAESVVNSGNVRKKKRCGRGVGTGGVGEGGSSMEESKRDEVKAGNTSPAKDVPKPGLSTPTKKVGKGTRGGRLKKCFGQTSGGGGKKKISHCFVCGMVLQKCKRKKGNKNLFCGPCGIQMKALELLNWKMGGDSECQQESQGDINSSNCSSQSQLSQDLSPLEELEPVPELELSQTDDIQLETSQLINPAPLEDPLSEVNAVRQQIQEAEKQVEEFKGNSKDKEYKELDELFTQFLIKLDTIETGGSEEVRNARKECVIYIDQCIAKLEKKDMVNMNHDSLLLGGTDVDHQDAKIKPLVDSLIPTDSSFSSSCSSGTIGGQAEVICKGDPNLLLKANGKPQVFKKEKSSAAEEKVAVKLEGAPTPYKVQSLNEESLLLDVKNLTISPPPSNNSNGNHATDNTAIPVKKEGQEKLVKHEADRKNGGKKKSCVGVSPSPIRRATKLADFVQPRNNRKSKEAVKAEKQQLKVEAIVNGKQDEFTVKQVRGKGRRGVASGRVVPHEC